MKRRTSAIVAAAWAIVIVSVHAYGEPASRERPNLIVIMVDDMGYAGVSCFGNPYFKTPQIDRLAAEGMRLTDFHSSGAVCSPTRAGLLTGRYQQRAGIETVIYPLHSHPEFRKGLKEVEITFAEELKKAGYATGLIGKWHQGFPENSAEFYPQNHGFDEFVGYHSGNVDYISHCGDHGRHDWWHGREETPEEGYTTDLINRYALDFIRRHRNEPFCLYIAHEGIHNPVQVRGDPVRRRVVPGNPIAHDVHAGWDKWKPASEQERIEKYKGMTLPIDEGVGQIRSTLKELGLDRNTVVMFFSDNGPASWDFPSGSPALRGSKASLYEGGHRVPAIAWWPGRIEAGTVSDVPAISIDLMPTMLSLAGVQPSQERPLDGIDLSPLLLDQKPLPDRALFWSTLSAKGKRSDAMRDGPWKLVVQHPNSRPGTRENPRLELYNLDDDLKEQHNLAEEYPGRATAMLKQMDAWFEDVQSDVTPQVGGWIEKTSSTRRVP